MDRIIDRLPSPGGLALWLYAIAFVVLPALLAFKGFAYVIGIVLFAVGVRPHIDSLVSGVPVHFAMTWRGKRRVWDYRIAFGNERKVVRWVSTFFVIVTMLIVPLLVFVVQYQGRVFYLQLEQQLPAILSVVDTVLKWAHDQLPGYVPDVDVKKGAGWEGLSDAIAQIAGDAVKDIKSMVQGFFGGVIGFVGGLLTEWVKLVIAAIIIGTMLSGWDKEVKMHRSIIKHGIREPGLRANVLRFGELYQTGISLFMIGYLEVGVTLSVFFGIAMLVLPLGLGIGTIVFMSIVLGFITAIPKIGGILGMVMAALLMLTNIQAGLGWFGWTVVSFGTAIDIVIRLAIMLTVTKLLGVLEAYSYTPEIIGDRLGMTKMQIIATVIVWALGAGFFGMIWGVLLSLSFQAALRLSQEIADKESAATTEDEIATEQKV